MRICPSLRLAATGTLAALLLALAGCTGGGTKLQPPAASIQQLTEQSDGNWAIVVRVQNYSYNTGMHVFSLSADLTLDDQPAAHLAVSPGLDIPAMDADTATLTVKPDARAAATLAKAGKNAVPYTLKGTLTVGKDGQSKSKPFDLKARGYISPVPGVSNIWR